MHPLVDYEFIGRLESFGSDLATLREMAGLPDVPWKHAAATKRDRPSVYEGRPDRRHRVERMFAKDFELYGY
jgi:hypothetical protein